MESGVLVVTGTRRGRTPRHRWWTRVQEMGAWVVVNCQVLVAVEELLLELAGSVVVDVEGQHLGLVQQAGWEVEEEVVVVE